MNSDEENDALQEASQSLQASNESRAAAQTAYFDRHWRRTRVGGWIGMVIICSLFWFALVHFVVTPWLREEEAPEPANQPCHCDCGVSPGGQSRP